MRKKRSLLWKFRFKLANFRVAYYYMITYVNSQFQVNIYHKVNISKYFKGYFKANILKNFDLNFELYIHISNLNYSFMFCLFAIIFSFSLIYCNICIYMLLCILCIYIIYIINLYDINNLYIIIGLIYLKVFILTRQVHLKKTLFVTIGILQI